MQRGRSPRAAIEGPNASFPDGFDWTYFQAAPEDQRIEHPRGDEWIVLEGLLPGLPSMRTQLPGVRGVREGPGVGCLVHRAGGGLVIEVEDRPPVGQRALGDLSRPPLRSVGGLAHRGYRIHVRRLHVRPDPPVCGQSLHTDGGPGHRGVVTGPSGW